MKRTQLVLAVLVIIVTIIILGVVVSLSNQVEYSVLFSDMEAGETGEVYSVLEEMDVPVKAGTNGTILVPSDQADELRYKLNAQGYPKSGLNYDIYTENATSFGLTDSDKKLYLQFQLEQNISQTINRMDKIKSSTVMITMPEDSAFVLSSGEDRAATASVVLELRDGATLTSADADTIRAVVSKSVSSLPPENITIADSKMNIYGPGSMDGSGSGAVGEQIDLQNKVAEQLKAQIINLLSPVFGAERLSASVNVILDFDKSVTNSITLSPPVDTGENMGIIVSMQEMQERVAGETAAAAEGEPGVDANGGAPVYQETTDDGDGDYYKVTRELNAEVNEINQQLERAQGQIKDLSATLIIDGGDELSDILPDVRKQIATAIGVPEDKITVSNMPFEQNTQYAQTMSEQTEMLARVESGRMIQTLIIAGAIIGAALIIIMSLLSRSKKKKREEEAETWGAGGTLDVAADEEISVEELMAKENSTLEQIQSLVRRDSELIAQLLKNWLSDDYMR